MCGRYTLHHRKNKLAEAVSQTVPQTVAESYEPSYNISPGTDVLSLASFNKRSSSFATMLWGLKTPQNFHINARIESADTAPRFRESWEDYRCLIPASGFYEWFQNGVCKQPYYIFPENDEVLFFGGLWFPSSNHQTAASCVILTTEANEKLKQIHKRMPVLIKATEHEAWLKNRLSKKEAVAQTAAISLNAHTVSHRVNSAQVNDSNLIEATAPLRDDQMMLF